MVKEKNFKSSSCSDVTFDIYEFDPKQHLYQQSIDGSNSYFYRTDGLGRRVHSTYNNGAVKKFYIFDGERLLGEVHGTVPAVAYTWGADGLVSERLISQNRSLYYHFGPQGETRYLTDSSGDIADSYLYTAYGVLLDESGNDSNSHRYGGKYGYYTDGPNSIILAGHRWYHPGLMRWLTRDPIGFEGGDNLYQYVSGNPVRFVDPSGLDPTENLSDLIVGFGDGITLGIVGPPIRKLISSLRGDGWVDPIVDDSPHFIGGETAGQVLGAQVCGGFALRGAAELSRFKSLRFLNQNRYLRVGRGKMPAKGGLRGGPDVPRLSLGPNRPSIPRTYQRERHVDIRIRPFDG